MTSASLPPPPIPPAANLSDFQFMPLQVARLRKSKAWLICKRRPELAFYMINLWTAAWHERPAGSLEDDDDVLADLAMCSPEKWDKVRNDVLRGWVKCSDGRLYHPVVAEVVLGAWQAKSGQRHRTLSARIAGLKNRMEAAKTPDAKSRMENELRQLSQDLSQTLSQTESQKADARQIALSLGLPASVTSTKGERDIRDRERDIYPAPVQGLSQDQSPPPESEGNLPGESALDPDRDPKNHAEWLKCRDAYPDHIHGDHHWLTAERDACQRVEEGERWSVIRDGCRRIRAQMEAMGKIGTEFVPAPNGFFTRREKRYLEPFPLPATKADQRLSGNVAAAAEAKRRLAGGST